MLELFIQQFFLTTFLKINFFTCTSQTREDVKLVSDMKQAGKLCKECGNRTQDVGVGWLLSAESGNQTKRDHNRVWLNAY